MQRRLIAASVTLGIVLAGAAFANQHAEKAAPLVQTGHFQKCVGTWDATVVMNGETSKGTETARTIGDGLWLITDFESTMAGAPFKGHGITGYDPQKKKYTGVWVDTMSPMPMHMEGEVDASGNVMTAVGEMADPMAPGKRIKTTMKETWTDANTRVFTMSMPGPDGKTVETMTITYKRK